MKKLLVSTILSTSFLFFFSLTTIAQPVRDGVTITPDTTTMDIQQLTNPSFQNLLPPTDLHDKAFASESNKVSFNKTTKLLLGIGTGLLRGDNEDYPIYSLENAWRYPGPTVRYPETVTEYESFLKRYDRYSSDSQ